MANSCFLIAGNLVFLFFLVDSKAVWGYSSLSEDSAGLIGLTYFSRSLESSFKSLIDDLFSIFFTNYISLIFCKVSSLCTSLIWGLICPFFSQNRSFIPIIPSTIIHIIIKFKNPELTPARTSETDY